MKKTLYLSLVAMTLANVDVQGMMGPEPVKFLGLATDASDVAPLSEEERLERSIKLLRENNSKAISDEEKLEEVNENYFGENLREIASHLQGANKSDFIDLLEQATGASPDAWRDFYRGIDENCVISQYPASKKNVALCCTLLFCKNTRPECYTLRDSDSSGIDMLVRALTIRTLLSPLFDFCIDSGSVKLDLNYSSIGDSGIKKIAQLLSQENSIVGGISAKFCGIGPEGCEEVAKHMENNSSLRELYLSNNPVMERGGRAIAEAVRQHGTIERLSMECTEGSIDSVVDAINENHSLRRIVLDWLRMPTEKIQLISDAVERRNVETKVVLPGGRVLFPGGAEMSSTPVVTKDALKRSCSSVDARKDKTTVKRSRTGDDDSTTEGK